MLRNLDLVLLLTSSCLLCLAGVDAFPLKIERLFISPTLPTVGEKVRLRAAILNETKEPVENIKLFLLLVKDGREREVSQYRLERMEPGERRRIEIGEWTPKENGIYQLKLIVEATGKQITSSLSCAIVEREVEFAWYGTPKDLRWATISTTIEKDYIEEWLWEGRTPLVFKPGVCFWDRHKGAPIEQQVSCWSGVAEGAAGIGIDEYGGGEAGDKVQQAIKMFKEKHPNLKIALWTIGGVPEEIAPYVDYFLPECYLNYYNMHLGTLMNFIKEIKDKGLERKTLLGLGINYQPNQGMLLTTPEELERQFRMLKSSCPNLLGVAIFHYGSVPELDRLADELFYRYFILPVFSYEWEIKIEGEKPMVVGWIRNIGSIDGGPAEVILSVNGKATKKKITKGLKVGETENFSFALDDLKRGFHIIEVKVKAAPDITVLDSEKEEAIGIDVPALKNRSGLAIWLPSCPHPRQSQPLRFQLPKGWSSATVFRSDSNGKPLKESAAQTSGRGELVWIEEYIPAGENCFYIIYPEKEDGVWLSCEENIEFANSFYQASLDISRDEISRLRVKGEEIFSSPWRMDIHPPLNLQLLKGEAKFRKGEVFQEVVVPFEGEGLKGESDYIFYLRSPIMEIRRKIIPEGDLEIDSAREGAAFEQRGGFFQAFPGEGAMRVNKGQLENSEQYRDIYFGYLGGSPAPDNRRKTGWFDFCWDKPSLGLGIAIGERWIDSKSRTYDVTRYYDGGDWVDIFYVFQTNVRINRPQESFIVLLPHKSCDLEKAIPPILPFYWTERRGPRAVSIFNFK